MFLFAMYFVAFKKQKKKGICVCMILKLNRHDEVVMECFCGGIVKWCEDIRSLENALKGIEPGTYITTTFCCHIYRNTLFSSTI